MAGLDEGNDPEKEVDVEEEEQVCQEDGVVGAPFPQVVPRSTGWMLEKREIEGYGRERDKESYHKILQIPHLFCFGKGGRPKQPLLYGKQKARKFSKTVGGNERWAT